MSFQKSEDLPIPAAFLLNKVPETMSLRGQFFNALVILGTRTIEIRGCRSFARCESTLWGCWPSARAFFLPDTASGGLGALETLRRLNARQAVPDGYEPLGGPAGDESRQLLLAGEGIGGSGGCRGGSRFCGPIRCDVVVAVNRKRRHNRSPLWCHALRGDHMDHSALLERQGNCSVNQTMAKNGRCAAGANLTFITRGGKTSKRILAGIDPGEGIAMEPERPQMAAGDTR
jgi:hypothetical protein